MCLFSLWGELCWLRRVASDSDAGLRKLAHLALEVVGKANFGNEFDLGFQKIDVLFCVVQDVLQQIT